MIKISNKEIMEVIKIQSEYEMKKNSMKGVKYVTDLMTANQMGISIIWGFTTTLMEVAKDKAINVKIDLTYKTVNNMMMGAYGVLCSGMSPGSQYSFEENVMILKKTIASYLMILAMNEENAKINVVEHKKGGNSMDIPNAWGPLYIKLCGKMYDVDLLDIISKDTEVNDKKIVVNMENVIKAYQNVTGKNLAEYGVESLTIGL